MTQSQVAINAAAIRGLAATLALHGVADPQELAEAIARQLLRDGFAPIRLPVQIVPRGPGSTEETRQEVLARVRAEVARAKAARQADPDVPMATDRQLSRLAINLSQDGMADRQQRLDWCSAMVGRTVTSSRELTRAEAARLIDAIEVPVRASAPPPEEDPGPG